MTAIGPGVGLGHRFRKQRIAVEQELPFFGDGHILARSEARDLEMSDESPVSDFENAATGSQSDSGVRVRRIYVAQIRRAHLLHNHL